MMMKRNLMLKKKENRDQEPKKMLISINVMGSAGPLRLVVNDDEAVASVIHKALKIYEREGRLPLLGSHVPDFLLFSNATFDAMNPGEAIGSKGGSRKFVLCKKQRQPQMTEARSQMVANKASCWKAWILKSFSFNIH